MNENRTCPPPHPSQQQRPERARPRWTEEDDAKDSAEHWRAVWGVLWPIAALLLLAGNILLTVNVNSRLSAWEEKAERAARSMERRF